MQRNRHEIVAYGRLHWIVHRAKLPEEVMLMDLNMNSSLEEDSKDKQCSGLLELIKSAI